LKIEAQSCTNRTNEHQGQQEPQKKLSSSTLPLTSPDTFCLYLKSYGKRSMRSNRLLDLILFAILTDINYSGNGNELEIAKNAKDITPTNSQ